jgi:queuine tRNA-ribosyltransferase
MRFHIQETASGPTVFDETVGECFKSRHSAEEEAEAVFFQPGLAEHPDFGLRPLSVLELGFGLGTNFLHLSRKSLPIRFVSIERDFSGLDFYLQHFPNPLLQEFLAQRQISAPIQAQLIEGDFFACLPNLNEEFDCVFFDPFSPKANPDCWTEKLFAHVFAKLRPNGRLVTYSVSRNAKDSALAAGFHVWKRDLPEGLQKRSSLLAIKPRPL